MSKRPQIPQRRRIFLGCEGESEQSYGALLARLVEERHRRIHLDTVLLQPGGGDPLALVELAIARLGERAAKRGAYAARAVLLDADSLQKSRDRAEQAKTLAARHDLNLIWQEPCHEALLLRHLDGCSRLRPPTTVMALEELKRRWPDYAKATPANRLSQHIDEAGVLRAAQVEPALGRFLQLIGFGQA